MKFKDRLKKLRLVFIYPIGILAIFFFNSSDISLAWGIPVVTVGLIIRVWANGYAVKMDKLTTSGPYAFFQHPLYIGTLLIAAGCAIILNSHYIGVLFVLIVAIVYLRTIRKEEKMLKDKFGREYIDYRESFILRVFRFTPYRSGEKWKFSLERLIRSKEHKTVIWIIILIIGIHIKEEFVIEHEAMDSNIWYSFVGIAFLAAIDFVETFVRSKRQKKQEE